MPTEQVGPADPTSRAVVPARADPGPHRARRRPRMNSWTKAGRGTFATGCVLGVIAYGLGYTPLAVIALACLAACAAAAVLTAGRLDARTARLDLSSTRLTRGETCAVSVHWSEGGFVASRLTSLALSADPGLDVYPVCDGRQAVTGFDVVARRRGQFEIGPLSAERADPLGLLVRRRVAAPPCTVQVRPAVRRLPMRATVDRGADTDGRSPAAARSSIAFESLREYSEGDDIRQVHWPSSLRRADGGLLVRVGLESTEPEHLLVLDTDARAYPPGEIGAEHFEAAVDIAASIAMSCIATRRPLRLATSGGLRAASRGGRGESGRLLDLLADLHLDGSNISPDALEAAVAGVRRFHAAQLIVVTGTQSTAYAATELVTARWCPRIVVIRVGERASRAEAPATAPTTRHRPIDYLETTVNSLDALAAVWPPDAGMHWSSTPPRRDSGHGRSVAATAAAS